MQIGHVRDEQTQKLVPLHLTEACSPDFPNLFYDGDGDDEGDPPIPGEPAPAFAVIAAAAEQGQ